MEYRVDREALAAFISRQVDLIESAPVPELLSTAADLRLGAEGEAQAEIGALWLSAGLATLVGLAILEAPERFITTAAPPPRAA